MPVEVVQLSPNWTDLLLWAVLKGKHSLTRQMWEQTEDPLRAAIILTRVTKHMAETTKPSRTGQMGLGSYSGTAELTVRADEYERWATGLLSRVPEDDNQQIMDLLTRAPMRFVNGRAVYVWPNSVLDEATERAEPCMEFVAHPHCQAVLSDYWHGNYVGSRAAIPRCKLLPVFAQIFIKIVCFNLPPAWASVLTCDRSAYSQPPSAATPVDEVSSVEREDDEFCRAYFSVTARREMRRKRNGEELAMNRESSAPPQNNTGRRRAMSVIARTTMAAGLGGGTSRRKLGAQESFDAQQSLDSIDFEDWAVEQWEEWLALHWHFWAIPKVRFVVDATFRTALLLNQALLVTGHYHYTGWMPTMLVPDGSGSFTRVSYVDVARPPYITYTVGRFVAETFSFLLALARVFENLQSVHWSPFIFYTTMKAVDLCNCAVIVVCYVLRIVTALAYAEEFAESYTGQSSIARLLTPDGAACSRMEDADCPRLTAWSRVTTAIMSFNAALLAFTFLVTLGYNRVLGQALTMLFAMIADSTSVLVIIFVLAVGFGVASKPLLPTLVGDVDYAAVVALAANATFPTRTAFIDQEMPHGLPSTTFYAENPDNRNFLGPLWLGAYGSISLMDVGTYDGISGISANDTTVAALLLWVFAFFVSVFCMNLLIARMASRYEAINNSSSSYRAFQHIALIKRYKDEGPPPPFNLIVLGIQLGRALLRRLPPTRRFLAPLVADLPSKHHHFTVYSGPVATTQSARIERSYLRDYVREDGAHKEAARKEVELVHQAVTQGLWSLRQGLSEELDKLEGRLEGGGGGYGGGWRPPTRVRFDSGASSLRGSSGSPRRTDSPKPAPTRSRSFKAMRQQVAAEMETTAAAGGSSDPE